jgi:hypothetical protein
LDAVPNEADNFPVRPAELFESRYEVVDVEVRGKALREVDGPQIAVRVRVEKVPDDALGFGVNVLLSDDEALPELDRRAFAGLVGDLQRVSVAPDPAFEQVAALRVEDVVEGSRPER